MPEVKRRVRINVLGSRGVGKTTLVFRYMARLFAGVAGHSCSSSGGAGGSLHALCEPRSTSLNNLYNHCVCLDNVLYDLEILDLTEPNNNGPMFERISDAFIVVYSVACRADFNEAAQLRERLRTAYPDKPVLLIGNKSDLMRQVSTSEGQKVGGYLFAEVCSTQIGSWEVHQAMYRLLRRVSEMAAEQTPANTKCRFTAQNDVLPRRESLDTSSG